MISLQYAAFGEPAEVIAPVDSAIADPGPGEVRLQLVRSPIHNHDLATIRGVYGQRPQLPALAGSEFLGVVDALGAGVANVREGARVAGVGRGAWSEYIIASAATLAPIPDAIDDDRACQLLAMPASAVVLFDELHVKAGDWIVQNAANGTVGTILVRIAQNNGVNVLNLVRRESAAVDMRNAGAKHVIVTDGSGWQQQARELTEEAPIVRAIDSISGSASLDLQRLLAHGGEMIVFGGLAGQPMKLDPSLMISNELVVRGFWMTAWMQRATAEQRANASRNVFEMAMKNELPLPVAAVFPLDKAAAALKAAEAPGRGGKVLLRP